MYPYNYNLFGKRPSKGRTEENLFDNGGYEAAFAEEAYMAEGFDEFRDVGNMRRLPEPEPYEGFRPPGRPPQDGFRPPVRPPQDGFRPPVRPPYDGFRPPEPPPFDGFQPYPPDNFRPMPPENPPGPNIPGNKPKGVPPRVAPEKPASLLRIDSGAIRNCLYSYTYVWLVNGREFWFYPTFVGRESISGYRYTRRGWVYLGFNLNMIESFYCAG